MAETPRDVAGVDVLRLDVGADVVATVTNPPVPRVEPPTPVELSVHVVPVVGPPGRLAAPALPAAHPTSGHRVVTHTPDGTHLRYADHQRPGDLQQPVFLTTAAAAAGDVVQLAVYGEVVEPSWTWQPGARLFLGADGLLTQVPPTTGYLRTIGAAITSTSIWLQPEPALELA